jgi:hypothetical protein
MGGVGIESELIENVIQLTFGAHLSLSSAERETYLPRATPCTVEAGTQRIVPCLRHLNSRTMMGSLGGKSERRSLMHPSKILLCLLAAALLIATPATVCAQEIAPSPEMKKLAPYLGHWTYEGENAATPVGQAGKVTGKQTCEMVLDGHYLRMWNKDQGADDFELTQFISYDPAKQNFRSTGFGNDGTMGNGTIALSGRNFNWTVKVSDKQKEYQYRGSDTFSEDGMSYTSKSEFSADGKTWIPSGTSKSTKVVSTQSRSGP